MRIAWLTIFAQVRKKVLSVSPSMRRKPAGIGAGVAAVVGSKDLGRLDAA